MEELKFLYLVHNNRNTSNIKMVIVYAYFQGQMVDFSSHETAGVCLPIDIHTFVTQQTVVTPQLVSKSWCVHRKQVVTDSEQRPSSDMFYSDGASTSRRPSFMSLSRPDP